MRRVEVIPKIWVGVAPTHPTRNQTHGVVQPEAWLIAKMSHGSMLLIFAGILAALRTQYNNYADMWA